MISWYHNRPRFDSIYSRWCDTVLGICVASSRCFSSRWSCPQIARLSRQKNRPFAHLHHYYSPAPPLPPSLRSNSIFWLTFIPAPPCLSVTSWSPPVSHWKVISMWITFVFSCWPLPRNTVESTYEPFCCRVWTYACNCSYFSVNFLFLRSVVALLTAFRVLRKDPCVIPRHSRPRDSCFRKAPSWGGSWSPSPSAAHRWWSSYRPGNDLGRSCCLYMKKSTSCFGRIHEFLR